MERTIGEPAIEQKWHKQNLKTLDGMGKVTEEVKQPSVLLWQKKCSNVSRICLLLSAKRSE